MNEIEKGKSNLQEALLEVSKQYLEHLELAPKDRVFYSLKLRRKMERLLKDNAGSSRKRIPAFYRKAIAACLAAFIFIGASMTCEGSRKQMIPFYKKVYKEYTKYFFKDKDTVNAPLYIEELRLPAYIPEGYTLVESPPSMNFVVHVYHVWKTKEGSKICFSQATLRVISGLDTENAEIKRITNGVDIELIVKEAYTIAFWNDNLYSYKLITYDLSEVEIMKIIDSVY